MKNEKRTRTIAVGLVMNHPPCDCVIVIAAGIETLSDLSGA
jgi:hypothetical protein